MADKAPRRLRLSFYGCVAAGLYLVVMLWAVSIDRYSAEWGSPLAGFWTFVVMFPVAMLLGSLGVWPIYANNWIVLLAVGLSMAWVYVVMAAIETALRDKTKR